MAKKAGGTVPVGKVQSLVKKEISSIRADAARLSAFLKSVQAGPERLSIKVCDCCIKIE
ncbi:MAG TPA: hypothetical protein VH583_04570 [Vicinamibacterales bacterium]|jgi:hypothetical protein